jgi:hypothetical protein
VTIQKTKVRKTFNYLIRAAIILVTYGFIYRQVFVEKKLHEIPGIISRITEQKSTILMLILILFLMLINWSLESVKWQILIAKIEQISFFRAFKAVMTGVSVSLFTPNRTGDYLGRVFILEKGNHIEGILITLIGSFAQIIITVSTGLFCSLSFLNTYLLEVYHIPGYFFTVMIFIVPCIIFITLLLYFKISILSEFICRYLPKKWERYIQYSHVISGYNSKELMVVLFLSFLRYLIFSTQFFLLLWIFGTGIPFDQAMILIPVIYLVMTLVPTVALTDLGIRGSVSIFIFGLYFEKSGIIITDANMAILAATTVIWLINLIIPAISGTFFVYSLKFFRK